MHHTQTWWDYRHLDNILFVHYNDLIADLPEEVRRIAAFLDIPIVEEALPAMMQALSLLTMRDKGTLNPAFEAFWKEGAKTFFFKGTNGRWKDVLDKEELALYEGAAANLLTPDCRAWLEQGIVG